MRKLFILIALSTLISCNPDDELDSLDVDNLLLLKEVYLNNVLIGSYKYYEDDKVKTITPHRADGALTNTLEVTYQNDSTKVNYLDLQGENNGMDKYFRVDSSTIRKDRISKNGNLTAYELFKQENEKCDHERWELFEIIQNQSATKTIIYSEINCNYVENQRMNNQPFYKLNEVILDDKHAANKSTIIYPLSKSIGNVLKFTQYLQDGSVDENQSYSSTIVYNEQDYPTSEVRGFLDGVVLEYNFVYH